ncbi:MAG TPA: type II secretion system F family protein [Acidisarcina sp.]
MLIVVFLGILLVTFALVAIATRATEEERTLDQRLSGIKTLPSALNASGSDIAQLWKKQGKEGGDLVERSLVRLPAFRRAQISLRQAQSSMSLGGLLLISLGLAACGYFAALLFVPVLPVELLAAAVAAYLPFAYFTIKRVRRVNAFNAALPEAIDMMARALRAGHSMVSSIEMMAAQAVEPARSEFAEVFKQQNFGLPIREALMQLMERVPSQDLRVLVTAILVQKDTGGNLAEILDRTVFVIRERLRIQGEIQVQTAQGRLTGWILTALPVVMMVVINLVDPGYSHVLFVTPMGHKLMYIGVGLMVTGSVVIRRIVNGIEI